MKEWKADAHQLGTDYFQKLEAFSDITAEEIKKMQEIEQSAIRKSDFFLKMLIFGMCVQFVVLYIITYGVEGYLDGYGWDVGEPCSYLLALGIEMIALLYWIRRKRDLSQGTIFKLVLQKRLDSGFMKVRTCSSADVFTLKSKLLALNKKCSLLR